MKYLAENGNWKGGISLIRRADDLLTTTKQARAEITKKLMSSYVVDPVTGCWNWTGSVFKSNGRACLNIGVRLLASRLMYVAVYRKPLGELCVLHSCDNVLCVRPAHLKPGTNQDNSDDMIAKGRQASGDRNGSRLYPERLARGDDNFIAQHPEVIQGERNGMAKLTEAQAREILARYRPYVSCRKPSNRRELANEYGVTLQLITALCTGKTWRHLS